MILINIVSWDEAQSLLKLIRHEVFVVEQQVPAAEEWDSYDDTAVHFLATDSSGEPVATARFLPSGKITRMAVRKPHRNRQVGSKILAEVLKYAAATGFSEVHLDAQITAVPFYEKFGFICEGEVFRDAGIDHLRMTRTGPGATMNTEADDRVHPLQHPSDTLKLMREFAASALRSLDIFSHQLMPSLYSDGELTESISQLARRGAQTQVRILVRDTRPLYGADHSLVRLAQRLPSHVHIRAYTEGASDALMGFFCADAANLVHFLDEPNLSGYARRNARAESRHLLTEFENLWTYGSRTDANLRRLAL
ncbi:MAG TPA: GNAT family N-acetyltransferase [Cellvibrio sp.]|nr:GNAT family N-acetyltransferase [Cellvibrio sp.]